MLRSAIIERQQGMLLHIGIADDFPVLTVPSLYRRSITTVLLVLCIPFLLMLLTVAAIGQPRAPGVRAGFLWFVWHGCLLFCIIKAPEGSLLRGSFSCSYNITYHNGDFTRFWTSTPCATTKAPDYSRAPAHFSCSYNNIFHKRDFTRFWTSHLPEQ